MAEPLSTHLPEVAGEFVVVTGEAVIKTGLRSIQAAVASLAVADFAANGPGKVSCRVSGTSIIIRVEDTGTGEGTLSTAPAEVSWIAVGK